MKVRCAECGKAFTTMSHVKTHPVVKNGPRMGLVHTKDGGVFYCGSPIPRADIIQCGPLEPI